MPRRDVGGIVIAVVFVLLALAFVAWQGNFIGTHVTDPNWPCFYGPKGTVCSSTNVPPVHRQTSAN